MYFALIECLIDIIKLYITPLCVLYITVFIDIIIIIVLFVIYYILY